MRSRLLLAVTSASLGLVLGCQKPENQTSYVEDLKLGTTGDRGALKRLAALSDDELASVLTVHLLSFTDRDRPGVVSMNLFRNLGPRTASSEKIAHKMFALAQEFSDSFIPEMFVEEMKFDARQSLIKGGLESRSDDNALIGSLRCAGSYGGQPESEQKQKEIADRLVAIVLWDRRNERRRPMNDEFLNTEITIACKPYANLITERLLKRLPEVTRNPNSIEIAMRVAKASNGSLATSLMARLVGK